MSPTMPFRRGFLFAAVLSFLTAATAGTPVTGAARRSRTSLLALRKRTVAQSLAPDQPVSRKEVEVAPLPAVVPPGLTVHAAEAHMVATPPVAVKKAATLVSRMLQQKAPVTRAAAAAAGAGAGQAGGNVKPKVFFLFMVYGRINNQVVWERFLAGGYGKGIDYQALVHCKTESECRLNIRSHLFEIIPSVSTQYCIDLVGGMNALLHAALLRAGPVQNEYDKFVFLSDSTLPVKPLVWIHHYLTDDSNSDFCVFPRNEWAEVPQNLPGGESVVHLAVKHHQWVVLGRPHAEEAVRRSHEHMDLMTRFQLNMGYHNTGCLDEFWLFATMYRELVLTGKPATYQLKGFNGGPLNSTNYEIQGRCDTFVHWVPRAEGKHNNMSLLAEELAGEPGTVMAPATESRPASFSRLSGDALVAMRNSNFIFARKIEDQTAFSGCAKLEDAFDELIFKEKPLDVLPGHEKSFVGDGVWLDNQRTPVTITSRHGSLKLQGSGIDMFATGGYCGNDIEVIFENGYQSSAAVSPDGNWLRWANGAVWPRA